MHLMRGFIDAVNKSFIRGHFVTESSQDRIESTQLYDSLKTS
jgi:hypothetical protein